MAIIATLKGGSTSFNQPNPSFDQPWNPSSQERGVPSLVEFGLVVLERKILKSFKFHFVIQSSLINPDSLVPKELSGLMKRPDYWNVLLLSMEIFHYTVYTTFIWHLFSCYSKPLCIYLQNTHASWKVMTGVCKWKHLDFNDVQVNEF